MRTIRLNGGHHNAAQGGALDRFMRDGYWRTITINDLSAVMSYEKAVGLVIRVAGDTLVGVRHLHLRARFG
jgi:hypothetical protein